MTVAAKTLFVALLVGVAHVISGIAVLVNPDSLSVTPLSALHWATQAGGYSHVGAGTFLILAGLLAIVAASHGMMWASRAIVAAMFAPQELLLLLQIYAICTALATGVYPDGYKPTGGAWFILTDQIWAWVLAVSHSLWLAAYLYGGRNGNRITP
jgi:hypothetical protein